VCMCVLIYIF